MRSSLNKKRPVLYTGQGTGGHAFVCDGYQGTSYFHFNWGWNGSYDGYFYISSLTPGGDNFNSYQGAVLDIHPKNNLPAAPLLISPVGKITDSTPTYWWRKVTNATWYSLNVKDSSGKMTHKWYRSSAVCTGSNCKVTPSTTLKPGSGKWWVRAYNSAGNGPWSKPKYFTLTASGKPAATTLLSPSGKISNPKPAYWWRKVDNATMYELYVRDGGRILIHKWYRSSSVCTGSNCKVIPSSTLKPGSGKWWVRTYNTSGYGPWSKPKYFTLTSGGKPAAATPVYPSGNITKTWPTFWWRKVNDATNYELYVKDSQGTAKRKTYRSASVCSGQFCKAVSPMKLHPGNAHWFVGSTNSFGTTWSKSKYFNVVSQVGFNSQFNSSTANNWYRLAGTASWRIAHGYFHTFGVANQFANVFYGPTGDKKTMYGNFTYEARLYRTGLDQFANGVWLRGSPNPPTNNKVWHSGYWFSYTPDGHYSVWKVVGGKWFPLVSWRTNIYVKRGGAWNVLKVVVSGSSMDFYINGKRVAHVINSSYSTGKVGIGMYRDSSAGTLYADYAKLSTLTTGIADQLGSDTGGEVVDEAEIMAGSVFDTNGSPAGFGVAMQPNSDVSSAESGAENIGSEFVPDDKI